MTLLLVNLFWLFILFLFIALLQVFKPLLKGKLGEITVHLHKNRDLGDGYVLLNNLTFADDQGATTQIDHVLISVYGLFVIETKNYKGWIFGSARQKTWTQKLYKKSYRFQNPLHQNDKHVKVVEVLLADLVEPECLHSLVVFMPQAEFKTPLPDNVCRGSAWTAYVKTFKHEVISHMTLQHIQTRLETQRLAPSWTTHFQHVQNLKQRHK